MTNVAARGPPEKQIFEHDKGGFEIELRDASEVHTMAPAAARKLARDIPPLRAPYAPPDEAIASELLGSAARGSDAEALHNTLLVDVKPAR